MSGRTLQPYLNFARASFEKSLAKLLRLMVCLLAILTLAHSASAQLAKTSWPKAYGDQYNTSSWGTTNLDGTAKWATRTDIMVGSQPAKYLVVGPDGTIYADDNGYLIALDPASGKVLWTLQVSSTWPITGPAVAQDGTIYVTSEDQRLYAISPSGKLKWSVATQNGITAPPTIDSNGTIYFGSTDNFFYAINPDGTQKWATREYNVFKSAAAIGADGTIFVSCGPDIFGFDPKTGNVVFNYKPNGPVGIAPVIGLDGSIYLCGENGLVYGVDKTGATRWTCWVGAQALGTPALGSNGILYVQSGDYNLYAIDTDSGAVVWTYQSLTNPPIVQLTPLYTNDGSVYIAQDPGYDTSQLQCLDALTGALRWSTKYNGYGPFSVSPAMSSTGDMIIAFGPYIVDLSSTIVTKLTLNPTTVLGGNQSTGTVTISNPAPANGIAVKLSSSDPSATVPASVTVLAGQTTASFTVKTTGVNSKTSVTISATLGDVQTAILTINPLTATNLSVNPTTVVGGNNSTGTVTISGPAPPGGTPVALKSGDPSVFVPASVIVPAGQTSAPFTITTTGVASNVTVTITATLNGQSPTATLTVTPSKLAGLSLNPATVTGGTPSTGTVTLDGQAGASGTVVNLSSSSSPATTPATVTVSAGQSSASFTITTIGVNAISSPTITATCNGVSKTAILSINPATLSGLSLSPNSVIGGNNSTGTVTLIGPAGPGGVVVGLSSGSGFATVPVSVTILAGQVSATFNVTTVGVASQTSVTITGTLNGQTQSATLTINPPGLTSITLNPGSLIGGSNSTGTVTLTGQAAASGTTVSLTSSDAAAIVPSSVTVAAGQTTATFTVKTNVVAASVTASISGALNGSNQTAPLTINPLTISSLALNPNSLTGGATSTATVTLNGSAGQGGSVVNLTSQSVAASVPLTVTVAAGQNSTTFPVTTSAVVSPTSAQIVATLGASSQNATLTINPAQIAAITLSPTNVTGGSSSTGTVTLNGLAGVGGTVVSLSSSSSSAMVPLSLTVAQGQKSGTFTVTTSAVSAQVVASISGSLNAQTVSTNLQIAPASITGLTLNPTTVSGGSVSTATVTLSSPAGPTGNVVALSSNVSAATVPPSVSVTAGQTSATFSIATSGVNSQTLATISASFNGQTQSAVLTISGSGLSGLHLNPTTVVGGNASLGTVTLTGPAGPNGVVVSLTSSSTSASVSSTVTVASGQSSAQFSVNTVAVTSQDIATITASTSTSTLTANLTIAPLTLVSIAVDPSSVTGGNSATGKVTLNGPAPNGTVTISLVSSNSALTVPATVAITSGQSSASFNVKTSPVAALTSVTLKGALAGSQQSVIVTILPTGISSLNLSPSSVTGGMTSIGTIQLTGPAPKGGVIVKLNSSDSSVTVPTSVAIGTGLATGTFKAIVTGVTAQKTVTVTASLNSTSGTATLTVVPPHPLTLTFTPTSVVGGVSSSGKVTLSGPAPLGGITINLSSNQSAVIPPATVNIPARGLSASFSVKTIRVGTTVSASVTASCGGGSASGNLTVTAPNLVSVSVSPSSVIGGKTATGMVVISSPAPPSGLSITLMSDQTSASVPATVMIAAGKTSANFSISTSKVQSKTKATIRATLNGVTKTATLTIS